MKAIICQKYGPPEVLQLINTDKPIPKDNEVLVQVKATTVNRTDCATLGAKPPILGRLVSGLLKPRKPILGTEFSGIVESVGSNVSSFKRGDRVFGLDTMGLSSHAEYLTIAEDKALTTMPDTLSFEQAAASLEGAHYGYNMINKVVLEPGQKVLVNGASGGIGSATVQLLKHFKADITAVCNTKNIERVKSLGANRVIDYEKEDFTKETHAYTLILDTVGKSSFGKCKPQLDPGGAYLSSELGKWGQNIFFALIKPVIGSKKVLFPVPFDCKRSVLLIKKLIEDGEFKAVIDRTYPLDQIADAFNYVNSGQKTGNVVITLA
jgi:NADPH:quinone reductase-like Zn-dependent oxidoreductase